MAKHIEDIQADINKMDDFRRVLEFVREVLPFINTFVPKDKYSSTINKSQMMGQLTESLIDESDRFEEI